MNKKILALIMALLFALQCFAFTGFAYEDVSLYDVIENEEFLRTLGIIAEDVDASETVTREKAALYVSRMVGTTYTTGRYKGVFADVPESNEYALAIETLADLGIVHGDGSYSYRPGDNLTYYEAACMFASVLGYGITGDIAERAYEYVNRNKIFEGVKAKYDFVNLSDLFMMIYNALHSGVLEQATYGSKVEFKMSEDDILYKNFGILYTYGTVVKNDLTYLWTTQEADEDTLEIEMSNDEILTVDLSKARPDTNDILGKYVTLYYCPNSTTKKLEYVYHDVEDSDKIYSLPFTQLNLNKSSIDKGEIYYYNDNEDEKKLTLSDDCALIYNNAVYKSHTIDLSTLKGKVGKVELVDYDSNKKYDVIKLKVYDSMVVGGVSSAYYTIYDEFDTNKTVSFNENDYTKIFVYDAAGNAINVEDIVSGDIISVAKSETYSGDDVLEIIVSKTFFNGKISEYDSASYEPKMVIDHINEYVVADRAAASTDYKVGSNIIGYVDAFGNLVYISEDYGRDLEYGIVIGTAQDSKGLKKDAQVKLRTLSGEIEILSLAENVTIDGETYKSDPNGAFAVLNSINTEIDTIGTLNGIYVVRYKKDADGNLKVIDTTKEGKGGDKDTLKMSIAGNLVVDGQNVIGREIAVKDGASVLCVAVSDFADSSLYEDASAIYSTTMKDAFRLNILYNVAAFNSDPDSSYSDLVLKFDASTLYYDDGFFVVDVVKQAYNAQKDENMYKIEGMLSGAKKSFWMEEKGTNKQLNASGSVLLTDELKNAVRGDVIRCVADSNNYIISYEYIYSRGGQNEVLTKPISSSDFTPNKVTSLVMHNGYVYSREGELIKCNNLAYGNVPNVADIKMESQTLYTTVIPSSVAVVVVDDTEEKIFAGSVDDILDYERFDNNCSMILTRFRSDILKEVIIYNK